MKNEKCVKDESRSEFTKEGTRGIFEFAGSHNPGTA